MVKTRSNKKPNQLFDKDFVKSSAGKVSKKKKKKQPNILSPPRSKRALSPPSSGNTTSDSSPLRKKEKHSSRDGGDTGNRSLTIVFARKRPLFSEDSHHHVKKTKSKKHKRKERVEEEDPRSTSASFKRKGMDRASRPDSPTRGIEEIDRIKFAIDEVKSGAVSSVQKAAFKWRVHADKLYRRLKGTVRIDGRNGPPPVLSRAEEDKLTTWIITMSERGFPVSSASLRNTVQNFLKQDKRQNPFTDDKPSMSWYKAFVRRNPKVKTVSSMLLTRSCRSIEAVLRGWFNELDTFLRCLDVIDKPERIWFFIAIDLYASTVSTRSANGQPNTSDSFSTREKVCTCIVSANAAGHVIPPFFVFRGLCVPSSWDPLVGAPLSSGLLFSQMGSSSKVMYSDWLENHFLPNIGPDRPTVLLLDCPEGHVDVDVFVTAQQNDVHMFRILPSIADMVCPVPEEMLKTAWEKESALWNTSHPLVQVSVKNAARIVGKAWPKIDQPGVIAHNFRKVGIYPVDPKVTESLVREKSRKDREITEVENLSAMKPAQSIIDLELFESNLDSTVREEYHRRLLSKDTQNETEHFREWKHLYEAVYGNIIPVQDVPVAEEEVTVSYVEHVMDESVITEAQYQQPVTVEVKDEADSSRIVLSSDLSSVPRDVINVALTMATDIATFRTESGNTSQQGTTPSTSEPVASQSIDTAVKTSSSVPGVASIPAVISDGVNMTTKAEASPTSASQPVLSVAECSFVNNVPKPSPSRTTSTAPMNTQKGDSGKVLPASKTASSPTVVNVIRVTPGEKRDVVKSNIAVQRTPIKPSKVSKKWVGSSSVIKPITKAVPTPEPVETLPLIHISDSGEVSLMPTKESKRELVEVTDVVEVESPSFRGLSADQVLQQIQVSEMEVGGTEVVTQETAMEVDVVTDTPDVSAVDGTRLADTIEVVTVSGNAVESVPPGNDRVSGTKGSTITKTGKHSIPSENNASILSQSSDSTGFGGPGDLPLMQDDVIIETEVVNMDVSEVAAQPSILVGASDGVLTADSGANGQGLEGEPAQGNVAMETTIESTAEVVSEMTGSKETIAKEGLGNIPLMQGDETTGVGEGDKPKGDEPGAIGGTQVSAENQEGPGDVPLMQGDTLSGAELVGKSNIEVGQAPKGAESSELPGEVPLKEGDAVTEEAPDKSDSNSATADTENSGETENEAGGPSDGIQEVCLEVTEEGPGDMEGTEIVISVDSLASGQEKPLEALASPAGTVQVVQQSVSSQDEMGEILAPSTEEELKEAVAK